MNKIIMRPFIVLFIALYTLCGCASESFGPSVGDPDSDPANPQASLQIKPVVNIPGSEVTRAGGVIAPGDAITAASFFRVDENYPSDWTGVTAISGGIAASTGVVTFSPLQYYLGDLKTKLVGIYPAINGTTTTWAPTTGTVTVPIDGATDIMATPIAEGRRGGSSHPALTFRHLLTQVQFDIVAATAQANTQWGKIESITVTGRTTSCAIVLPAPADVIGSVATLTFSTPGDLLAYKLDGTAATALAAPLTPNPATFGYCMFEPVTATAPLPLKVKTEFGGTVDVTIPTQRYDVGTAYVITLNLTEEKIEPTVTIDAWAPGGSISEDL